MDIKQLKEFEERVVELFNNGEIKSPVHLSGSVDNTCENELIRIFKENNISKDDWCFSTYRSHYHALLKGIDKNWLLDWIKDNKSIHVMNKEQKFFTSAIVGGCLPITLGVAKGLKLNSQSVSEENQSHLDKKFVTSTEDSFPHESADTKVYIFIGDMTFMTGIFDECFRYAINHKLPIKFIIECNYLSTDTDTAEVWGLSRMEINNMLKSMKEEYPNYFDYFVYERKYPHYGTGKFIDKIWSKEDVKSKGF